jgi:hypothetical protein
MQFSTARAEIAAQLGLDVNSTSTQTLINRWLNFTQQDIVGSWKWSWLQSVDLVTLAADFTTGTVGVTAGGSTITFSAGPAASQTNRYIQFSSADDWYLITAHTAAALTATISPAYIQTSNLVAGTFIIRTFYYPLASSTEFVYDCMEATNKRYIPCQNIEKYDLNAPFTEATGGPQKIMLWSNSSTNCLQFTPYPWPDKSYILQFRIWKKATDLSGDTDTPIFPDRFNQAWIYGSLAYGYRFMDDDRMNGAFDKFWDIVQQLKKGDNPSPMEHKVLKSVDQGRNYISNQPYPAEYGETR